MAAGDPEGSLMFLGAVLAGYSGVFLFIWLTTLRDKRSILPMLPLAASVRGCSASARTLGALVGVLARAGLVTGLKPLPFRGARVVVRQPFIRVMSIVSPLEPVVNGSICG